MPDQAADHKATLIYFGISCSVLDDCGDEPKTVNSIFYDDLTSTVIASKIFIKDGKFQTASAPARAVSASTKSNLQTVFESIDLDSLQKFYTDMSISERVSPQSVEQCTKLNFSINFKEEDRAFASKLFFAQYRDTDALPRELQYLASTCFTPEILE